MIQELQDLQGPIQSILRALVFAELARRWAAWKQALEGWNMQVSQQVLEWQAQARVEADLARSRADILRAIELRYRSGVPQDLAAAVAALTDPDQLSHWFDLTLTTDSLEAFRAAVGHPAPPANGQPTNPA